jgi:DNA-binding GntR family transcriptional regulator
VSAETVSNVASARIAESLRDQILTGRLLPGHRIRQEDLAEEFGASRLPVREALRILQSDGLVTLVANAGAWVARLNEDECAEVYQIRERLEPLLLTESIGALTEIDIDRLAALADEMQGNRDVETFLRLDREFHLLSFSRAETSILAEIVQRLWDTTQPYRRAFTQLVGVDRIGPTHLEHQLIVDAIRRGDSDDAERLLLGHIRRTRLELAKHPEVFSHA